MYSWVRLNECALMCVGPCVCARVLMHCTLASVVVEYYTGIGQNLFVQPASSSLIACPGRIPRQVERNTCHCCAT